MKRLMVLCAALLAAAAAAVTPAEAWQEFVHEEQLMLDTLLQAAGQLPVGQFELLLSEQADWYAERDYSARFTASLISGGGFNEDEFWWQLRDLTVARTGWLEAWLYSYGPGAGELSDWAGRWIDGEGGILIISEDAPGQLSFSIEVVRGPTFHLGTLDGKMQAADGSAEFRIRPGPDWDETVLNFERDGAALRVTGHNTSYWHGARAYFDGLYLRSPPQEE